MAESEAPHVRGFLFADLRGYTQFVEQHGTRSVDTMTIWCAAPRRHRTPWQDDHRLALAS
jgi:hypothetical protein